MLLSLLHSSSSITTWSRSKIFQQATQALGVAGWLVIDRKFYSLVVAITLYSFFFFMNFSTILYSTLLISTVASRRPRRGLHSFFPPPLSPRYAHSTILCSVRFIVWRCDDKLSATARSKWRFLGFQFSFFGFCWMVETHSSTFYFKSRCWIEVDIYR